MGGGPRTFPGGVTKWQWKRMLVKKREESQKRHLERQRRVFEMRERAEVLAAHPELQQPWEKLTAFPPPLSASSIQKQISALSSRFRKHDIAEDLWDHKDGPRLTPTNEEEKDQNQEDSKTHFDVGRSVFGSSSSPSRPPRRNSGSVKSKKGKEVSPIGKSMQDYLDSFETNPLGVTVERDKNMDGKGRQRL